MSAPATTATTPQDPRRRGDARLRESLTSSSTCIAVNDFPVLARQDPPESRHTVCDSSPQGSNNAPAANFRRHHSTRRASLSDPSGCRYSDGAARRCSVPSVDTPHMHTTTQSRGHDAAGGLLCLAASPSRPPRRPAAALVCASQPPARTPARPDPARPAASPSDHREPRSSRRCALRTPPPAMRPLTPPPGDSPVAPSCDARPRRPAPPTASALLPRPRRPTPFPSVDRALPPACGHVKTDVDHELTDSPMRTIGSPAGRASRLGRDPRRSRPSCRATLA